MGLAAKLAAAQAGSAPGANYSQQAGPGAQGQRPAGGSYPGQTQYQAYPGASQPGYSTPTPGGYNSPQNGIPPPLFSRPVPPPPNIPQQGSYGNQPQYGMNQQPYGQTQPYSGQNQYSYNQNQQLYGGSTYQQGPPGGYGYGNAPPPGQQGYNAPPQQQYGGPPQGQPQYGGPGQQHGGPPQGQPQYGGAPSQAEVQGYQRALEQAIQEKRLHPFYGPGTPGAANLPRIAQDAARMVNRLAEAWRIHPEIAKDIVRLALYDVVIFIDDSGSMAFEENGDRIDDLKLILDRVAFAATLFDQDGIEIRFMNTNVPENEASGIRSGAQAQQLVSKIKFKGLTPFGSQLRKKVIDPILVPRLKSQRMQKPLLIIGITDGQPAGEDNGDQDALLKTVRYADGAAQGTRYAGSGHVAFQFAQVGNDAKATQFLAKIDQEKDIGHMVDCTSNFENESAEMSRTNPSIELTPDMWILKLILGAIDPSYDDQDESGSNAPPHNQGGYGGPPQYNSGPPGGQPPYGAPGGQPHYGQAAPGAQPPYGQNPGYGPPGGQQGYNRPPPGPPQGQYQQYGGPPQPPRY